jgi:hypothetical protein
VIDDKQKEKVNLLEMGTWIDILIYPKKQTEAGCSDLSVIANGDQKTISILTVGKYKKTINWTNIPATVANFL